jgi:thiamine pyrophosphate-dependent acetolactate synthase large subunit-like protein
MLMGLGALATIGAQAPKNLSVVVIDNERYGETGMQATHTARGVNLASAARACGFVVARTIGAARELPALRRAIHGARGPVFAAVKVGTVKVPLVLPPREGALLKARFRRALLGEAADSE